MGKRKNKKIPSFLQPILWSCEIDHLDLKRDKPYIINQILSYGRMKDLHWLFKTYSLDTIVKVFLECPIKNYFPSRFHFVKNFILPLNNKKLDPRLYVQNTPRVLRPKKT